MIVFVVLVPFTFFCSAWKIFELICANNLFNWIQMMRLTFSFLFKVHAFCTLYLHSCFSCGWIVSWEKKAVHGHQDSLVWLWFWGQPNAYVSVCTVKNHHHSVITKARVGPREQTQTVSGSSYAGICTVSDWEGAPCASQQEQSYSLQRVLISKEMQWRRAGRGNRQEWSKWAFTGQELSRRGISRGKLEWWKLQEMTGEEPHK